ncbi:putative HTH-type transcriptional regulator YusO [bioreactor metagenome]|uniref:Putative HTH-type transcriptional regulator YusO n=1 Tax=bioreactor metagenome TaxID=1076179 RepID=A0A644Z9D9_9ZZZZ
MEQEKYEQLVENLFLIVPLLKKKLVKQDLYSEEMDLSPSHIHILLALEEMGSLSISELAKVVMVSKTNMTPLIQKLIDKNYVERTYDKKDRRYIYISLTEVGNEFLENHKALVINGLKGKISKLNEEELERISTSLEALKELLNNIE